MTTPSVIEIPRTLERVTRDTFLGGEPAAPPQFDLPTPTGEVVALRTRESQQSVVAGGAGALVAPRQLAVA